MSQLRKTLGKLRRKVWAGRLVRPTFMVIGAQKGGTTALAYYLGQHPQILRPTDKEVDYFGSETRYQQGEDFYHSHFRFLRVPKRAVTFDASPNDLGASMTAGRIHRYNPAAKIICLLREPVSRAFSAFNMYRRFVESDPDFFKKVNPRYFSPKTIATFRKRPVEHTEDFMLAVTEEINSLSEGFSYEWRLLDYGLYEKLLRPFLDFFPAEQMLFIDSSELRKSTSAALHKITAFLELPEYDWGGADTEPKHAEYYRETMSKEASDTLASFYKEPNRKLQAAIGIGANW
ncbi:sulfotransferase domain-containing protein [Verrucomicrobiales bacterium]|nr:sulfotransferase domain-containing protein [Verrucomicrobiales bacterium]MDC0275398.1 sulfotransferase domain-containing protein [Verrucomicrobiales bacterium]